MAQAPNMPPGMSGASQMPQGGMAMDPLAELRDIHIPGLLEVWPPAIGWWFLLALFAILPCLAVYWLYRRCRSNRYRREAIRELRKLREDYQHHGEDSIYINELQSLLKRVALTRFPREDVANLTGESWVAFLDHSSRTHEFSVGKGQSLIDSIYRKEPEVDVAALHELSKRWIKCHRLELAV